MQIDLSPIRDLMVTSDYGSEEIESYCKYTNDLIKESLEELIPLYVSSDSSEDQKSDIFNFLGTINSEYGHFFRDLPVTFAKKDNIPEKGNKAREVPINTNNIFDAYKSINANMELKKQRIRDDKKNKLSEFASKLATDRNLKDNTVQYDKGSLRYAFEKEVINTVDEIINEAMNQLW